MGQGTELCVELRTSGTVTLELKAVTRIVASTSERPCVVKGPDNRLSRVKEFPQVSRGEMVRDPMDVDCIRVIQIAAKIGMCCRGRGRKVGAFRRHERLGAQLG